MRTRNKRVRLYYDLVIKYFFFFRFNQIYTMFIYASVIDDLCVPEAKEVKLKNAFICFFILLWISIF